ncbi:MAG: hypothetical protein WAK22_03265, partial [Candidatus Sulfotelmatobacter sp.]
KAWVAGSNPAALTKTLKYFADFCRVDFQAPSDTQKVFYAVAPRFALSISREISPAEPSGRPSCVTFCRSPETTCA